MRPAVIALVLALLSPLAARAQETGGSFGGGSWGGGGGGGGGSSSGGSSSGGSGSGSGFGGGGSSFSGAGGSSYGGSSSGSSPSGSTWQSSSPTTSSGGPTPIVDTGIATQEDPGALAVHGAHILLALAILCLTAVAIFGFVRFRAPPAPVFGGVAVDVAAISLALDWRARRYVQGALLRFARDGDTRSSAGLASLLSATVATLREAEPSWAYAGVRNMKPAEQAMARAAFTQTVNDARARYRKDVVRSEDGRAVEQDGGPLRARPDEGEGLVVVTVVAAARSEIVDVQSVRDVAELELLLGWLGSLRADELVAMEVVWSPAAEDDRLSSYELEKLYPELAKLDPKAALGATYCESCGAPYPRELGKCPRCGAPASGSG